MRKIFIYFYFFRRGAVRSKEVLKVKVEVTDVNDNSPSFDKHIYQGSISESAQPGTNVALDHDIKVTDPDMEDQERLQLLGKVCSIIFAKKISYLQGIPYGLGIQIRNMKIVFNFYCTWRWVMFEKLMMTKRGTT